MKDDQEATALLDVLENTVLPLYYDQPKQFLKVVKTAMKDVEPEFESGRMAKEYYELLYKVGRSAEGQRMPERLLCECSEELCV